ncbi:hypothetical protein [Halomicrobium katesii]|uniref:hypothetical protein n=1 Tax=Halomicrobium katesii TaxID=437163 RepID=UPI0012BB02E6|nr:hypothetical protein [Halomicrobium katesii]
MGERSTGTLIIYSILIIFLLAAAGLIIYIHPFWPSQISKESAKPMDLLRVIIPGLFSASLVVLYFNMSKIQKEQSSIQKTQMKLDRAEREPLINVKAIKADGDIATVTLENIGAGLADQLSIVSHIYIPSHDDDSDSISIGEPRYDNQLNKTKGSFIRSVKSGSEADFSAELYLPSQEFDDFDEVFSSVLRRLDDNDSISTEDVYMQFEIQYDHRIPDKGIGRQFLPPMKITLDKGQQLEDILNGDSDVHNEVQSILKSKDNTLRAPQTTYNE